MNNNESIMKAKGEAKVLKGITNKNGKLKAVANTQVGQQMLFTDAIAIEPTITKWIHKESANVYRKELQAYFIDEQFVLEKVTQTLLQLAGSIYYGDNPNTGKSSKTRHKKVESIRLNLMPELSFALVFRFIEIAVDASKYFFVQRENAQGGRHAGLMLTYKTTISRDILEEVARKSVRAFYPMPTLQAPIDWSVNEEGKAVGGYEGYQFKLVRANSNLVDYSKFSQEIFDSINYIQSTPWKVNIPLLEAVRSDLKAPRKEDFIKTDFPDAEGCNWEIDIKDPTCSVEGEDLRIMINYREAYKERASLYRAEAGDYETALGKYRALKLAISVADQYKDEEAIYFPHSYDFRGRVYPLSIGLNPQGSDAVKALLLYKEVQETTEKGMMWNWAYLASLYGEDKLDFTDRVEKGKELIEADYKDADEPYQFLSHQLEMQKYSIEPSYIPNTRIHLDACNSGSQFTSAITGDLAGCLATNVIPTIEDGKTIRKDAYLLVAEKALELTDKLISKEGDHKTKETLKFLRGLLETNGRKICKVPVMVSNYGGTTGGRTDILWDMFRELDVERKWITRGTAALFSKIIGKSIVGVLNGGKAFEVYVHKMNNIIAKSNKQIEWTTSDGFNVVHVKYKELKPKKIQVTLPNSRKESTINKRLFSDNVSAPKMKSAISPNYIHSLDAELLRRVAMRMQKEGIEYSDWIHDSFGCHPNDVDFMLDVTKQEFRELVERDPLGVLDLQLNSQIESSKGSTKALLDVSTPRIGGFEISDLKQVEQSDWFFS